MKLDSNELDKLILEALGRVDEKFNLADLEKGLGKINPGDVKRGADPLAMKQILAKDIFNNMKDKGTDPSHLDITDVEHYVNNPEEITTPVQRRLITISRSGNKGDEGEYDKKVQQIFNTAHSDVMWTDSKGNEKYTSAKNWILNQKGQSFNKATQREIGDAVPRRNYNALHDKYEFYSNSENKRNLLAMAAKAEEALTNLDALITKASKDKQTITSPSFKSQQGSYGVFPPEQVSVVNRVLSKQGDIASRIQEVSRISKMYYDAATGDGEDLNELKALAKKDPAMVLSHIQLLDLFNSMVKEIDSGAGAYIFEYFLALISGGTVAGKELTAGGKAGAVDFKMGSENGSAKFFKIGRQVKQAVSGFDDMFRNNNKSAVNLTYVVGLKKQDYSQAQKTDLGSSDPAKIVAIEIYTPIIVYNGKRFEINGKLVPNKDVKGGQLKFGNHLGASKGLIYITEMRTKTFRQMISQAIGKTHDEMKGLFEAFKTYFEQLEGANTNAKEYVNEEDAAARLTKSIKVINNLTTAQDEFSKIKKGIDAPTTVVSEEMKENKQKTLDKLIEEVILEEYNGD